jgi:hypothetical protein
MMNLKQAIKYAQNMESIHKEPWLIFITPSAAAINQYPGNVHNTGRFACCRESEREDYAAGGAVFPAIPERPNQVARDETAGSRSV